MERGEAVDPGAQRVFFALWPDEGVRAKLAAAARSMHRMLHGRCTPDENLHLTLAFIGEIGVADLSRVLVLPAGALTAGFHLTLDRWECWARNGIGWAGPTSIPAQLRNLSESLDAWLNAEAFKSGRSRFTPHVTLVRDARAAVMPEFPAAIEWRVEELVLVRSVLLSAGARYQIVARWPLA